MDDEHEAETQLKSPKAALAEETQEAKSEATTAETGSQQAETH